MPDQMLSGEEGHPGSFMYICGSFFFSLFNEMGSKGYCLFLIHFCMF